MPPKNRSLVQLLVAAALLWHALAVGQGWMQAAKDNSGRDFASYYYAVDAAAQGNDPYDKKALGAGAREDGTRGAVHPYFYPPPFLLTMVWTRWMPLAKAYHAWYWLDELFALIAAGALWRWWRHLGPAVPAAVATSLALMTAVPNNHLMGQANLPVLALVAVGLWQDDRGRQRLGGALVGVACMLKMSPALFVAWWLLRRRWTAAIAACVTAVVLTLLSLPLVGFATQLRFYTEIMPGFSSGEYNGLAVGIDLFGNHSLPNVFDALFPNALPGDRSLSATARWWSSASLLGLVVGTGVLFARTPGDALARYAQLATVGLVMLVVPVFTYEHHLVWALPAMVITAVGVVEGRLGPLAAALVGLAWAGLCFDLAEIKAMSMAVKGYGPASLALQELKFAALVLLLAVTARLGASQRGSAG